MFFSCQEMFKNIIKEERKFEKSLRCHISQKIYPPKKYRQVWLCQHKSVTTFYASRSVWLRYHKLVAKKKGKSQNSFNSLKKLYKKRKQVGGKLLGSSMWLSLKVAAAKTARCGGITANSWICLAIQSIVRSNEVLKVNPSLIFNFSYALQYFPSYPVNIGK